MKFLHLLDLFFKERPTTLNDELDPNMLNEGEIVNLKKCGTVYQIHCEKCNKEYVGETARALEIRVKEHQSRSSSAVHEHCRLEGHSVDPNKTKVLSTEVNTFKRRIKEAIQIKLTKPALNRDNGYELAAIYDTILTPKRR